MGRISRRRFVGTGAAVLAQAGSLRAGERGALLLIGTGAAGIYGCRMDVATGELSERMVAAEAERPSFLAVSPDGRRVYAVEEVKQWRGEKAGGLMSFALDAGAGTLRRLSEVSSRAPGPCHVSTDKTGRCLFVADYAGGAAASYTVDGTGTISAPVSEFHFAGHGPVAVEQDAPHAHRVTVSPGNGHLLVNDLGLDCVHVYRLDAKTAKLVLHDPPVWKSPAGAGPRALRFHPNGKVAYCLCELSSTLFVLGWDEGRGTLETMQAVGLDPGGKRPDAAGRKANSAAEVVFDREARFLYASNREPSFLTTFAMEAGTGRLRVVGQSGCGGKTPRHIALSPDERWMVVANQDSNAVAVIARDRRTGRLAEVGKEFAVPAPQCCLFV